MEEARMRQMILESASDQDVYDACRFHPLARKDGRANDLLNKEWGG